jgi:hypothetical protein
MYFVTAGLLWFILDKISGGEFTHELGGVIGATIMVIYTIVYIVLFVIGSYNWIDIFHSISNYTFSIQL